VQVQDDRPVAAPVQHDFVPLRDAQRALIRARLAVDERDVERLFAGHGQRGKQDQYRSHGPI
jgi:hypothetical protein